MITFELNADNIQFKTILGVGAIELAKVNNFESKSGDGVMIA